jgi:hypothetical protein
MVNEDPGPYCFRKLKTGLEDRKVEGRFPGVHEVERIGAMDTVHEMEVPQYTLHLSESSAIEKSVLDHIEPMDRDLHGPQSKRSVDLQIVSKAR